VNRRLVPARAVRARIATFSPPDIGRIIAGLVVLTLLGGFAEAGTLVVVARTALAIADGDERVPLVAGIEMSRAGAASVALAALAVKLLVQIRVALVSARLAADTAVHARATVLRAYFGADWAHQSQERMGDLQDYLVTAVNQLAVVNSAYVTGLSSFTNLVVIVGIAMVVSPLAAVGCAMAAAVLISALRPLTRATRRSTKAQQSLTVVMAASVTESVRLTQEARVFGVRDGVLDSLGEAAQRLHGPQQRQLFMQRLAPAVFQTAALAFLVLAVLIAGALDEGDVGSLGAAVVLLLRGLGYGQQLQGSLQQLATAVPYLDKLNERTQRYRDLHDEPGTRPLEHLHEIEFVRTSFYYRPDVPVLHELTWRMSAGEAIGVVGPSGSGKSTLVQMLLRLRHPTSGAILVDGVDLRDVVGDDWARLTAFVPQDARMLHATIAENIAFFRAVDQSDIEHVARLAHIHDDIVSWPDGYDTHIGEAGNRISGGQRQRLAIARALVGHPDLLVLDEPTSALDLQSEARLQETLRDLKGTTGLVIVAHRMSTITLCDRMLVLRDGRIEGFDTHERLLEQSPFYREALRLSTVQHDEVPDVLDLDAPASTATPGHGAVPATAGRGE
jgi:ATP-binding cassette, subfamily B, bacterial